MRKLILLTLLFPCISTYTSAQPELYNDSFIGLPEFRALPLRLPTSDVDSIRIEVHVRIVYDDLQFVREDDCYEAAYGVDISLRDKKEHLASYDHADRKIVVETYTETNSRLKGDQTTFSFTLAPERLFLRIDLTDRESRKRRYLEKELKFDKKEWGDDFRLGDIVLVDSTGQAQMTSGLIQGDSLRAIYKFYCQDPSNTTLSYRLIDSENVIAAAGSVPLQDDAHYYTDTLFLPTKSLTDSKYKMIVAAQVGDKTILRSYPFDLLLQNLPGYIHDLDMAIRQLKYIASDGEYRQLTKARASQREEIFREFWKKKDPTPSTPANEKMEEYYRRVNYANEHFRGYRDGWESDMGHVYIIYGAPTDIERHPFDINTKPYEIWYYYDINRKFIFQDQEGYGDYRLVNSLWSEF